jgi:soluble lytic murein transglycosylase-like protein
MKKGNYLYWILGLGFLIAILFGARKLIVGSNETLTREYDALFLKYAQKYGLDAKMLKAIALHESSLGQDKRVRNKQVSRDGKTFGIFQIKLSVAQHYIKGITLDDLINSPEKGIEAASAFIADLKKKFNGDEKKIVISYNQGETHTKKGENFYGDYYDVYLKNKKLIG